MLSMVNPAFQLWEPGPYLKKSEIMPGKQVSSVRNVGNNKVGYDMRWCMLDFPDTL